MGAEALAQIAAEIGGCTRCPLHAGRNRTVPGEGNPLSDVLLVGEGPGAREDATGRPFVGPAGQLLDELLRAIGWAREDVFITNVVKCRPPKNRPPSPAEAAACRPFLLRQIELIQPRVVVLLGATAARHLGPLDERPMKERVGKLFTVNEFPGISFLILFHPAYLLRDPRRKPETKNHVSCLVPLLGGGEMGAPIPSNGSRMPAGACP